MGWKGYRLSTLPHIMARRNQPTRSRNVDPSVLTLTFATPATEGLLPVRSIIDLSQAASLANRRFYRQGLSWGVGSIKIVSGNVGQVRCMKLPNTWILANAWKKSIAVWSRMNSEALSETPSVKPRFLDFKIYADAQHHAAGYGANLLPFSVIDSVSVSIATPGEWQPSKIIIPDTTDPLGGIENREIIAVGANYPGAGASGLGAVSMIEGYAASRGLPNVLDPNVPLDAVDADGPTPANWMTAVFNEGTQQADAVIGDMITENNIAPYPFENDGIHLDTMYPGGANQMVGLEWHDTAQVYATSGTTDIGITSIKGGVFPCGLVVIEWSPTSVNSNVVVQVNLIPGPHRGYLAQSMQDM